MEKFTARPGKNSSSEDIQPEVTFKAIGAVAYLKNTHEDGQISVGFMLGKAKLTPLDKPTIPRLELC